MASGFRGLGFRVSGFRVYESPRALNSERPCYLRKFFGVLSEGERRRGFMASLREGVLRGVYNPIIPNSP